MNLKNIEEVDTGTPYRLQQMSYDEGFAAGVKASKLHLIQTIRKEIENIQIRKTGADGLDTIYEKDILAIFTTLEEEINKQSMNLDKLKQEIVEKALDKCTDPETGELHIGKYDHEYLEKVITAALTTLENN